MTGRKPKTAAQQVAEGDPAKRGKQKIAAMLQSESVFATGIPDCPRYLKGRARWLWNFLRNELESRGQGFKIDTPMLIGICEAFAFAVETRKPAAWMAFKSLAVEFPLTPVSRTRLFSQQAPDPRGNLLETLNKPRARRPDVTLQ